MNKTPYVIIKCAMSLDGYIDDTSDDRLILSNPEDFERVDAVRAECDAILVGAKTIRNDNPRLMIRSEERRLYRKSKGLSADLIKVTITGSGKLSKDFVFFSTGKTDKIVYCFAEVEERLCLELSGLAEIVAAPVPYLEPMFILKDLYKKGIRKLLIEGGSKIITSFISHGLVDELQVSVAPFFVGEQEAPRFANSAKFPHNVENRMKLKKVEMIGDMAEITYLLNRRP